MLPLFPRTLAASLLALAALLAPAPPAAAQDAAKPKPYSRITETPGAGAAGPMTFELTTRTFVPKNGVGPRVHLAGAVHIADKAFYESMQTLLDKNDLVLFEGVKPPGTGAIDAKLDDAGKAKATTGRIKFILQVVAAFREKEGRFPTSMTDLLENGNRRWKSLIEGALNDAWHHPLTLTIIEKQPPADSEFEMPVTEVPVLTSPGLDGAPSTADDLKVEGSAVAKGKAGGGGASSNLQAQMAKAFGLAYQLDLMDSGKPNWRSSDMDLDELQQRFAEQGADDNGLLKMLDGSSLLSKFAGWMMGLIGSSPQLSMMMKIMLVETLAQSDEAFGGGGGAGGGGAFGTMPGMAKMMKVIIEDRNIVVLKDLTSVIENEKNIKDVAIFYGAGHMNDFERRLAQMGYFPAPTDADQWTPAIRIDPKSAGMTAADIKQMRDTMRGMIKQQMAPKTPAPK